MKLLFNLRIQIFSCCQCMADTVPAVQATHQTIAAVAWAPLIKEVRTRTRK